MKKLLFSPMLVVFCLPAMTIATEKLVKIYIYKFTGDYYGYRHPKKLEHCGSVSIPFTDDTTLIKLMKQAASKANIPQKKQRHMFLVNSERLWTLNQDLTCGQHHLQDKDHLYLYVPLDNVVTQFFRNLPKLPGALLFFLSGGI